MLAAIILTALAASPEPAPLPPGYTCEDVRHMVAGRGKAASVAWALANGLSFSQIAQIRKQCKV